MGWGRTLLLGDIGNRLDIADCEKMLQELRRESAFKNRLNQSQDERIAALIKENGELTLYIAVLARLLISKDVFTVEEFQQFVEAIDSEDGKADGQYEGDLV